MLLGAYAASPLTLAFSAPGIAHAARVMFGELPRALHDKLEEDEMSTLTVAWKTSPKRARRDPSHIESYS